MVDPDEEDERDGDDERDGETTAQVGRRILRQQGQVFSGPIWQTVGSLPAVQIPNGAGYVRTADGTGYVSSVAIGSTAMGVPSHASYVNASQLLQTTTSG